MTKSYTYHVICSFKLQFTFTDAEVGADAEGREGALAPTQDALDLLASQLQECLEEGFTVTEFEAYADSDDLLGVVDKDD